MTLDSLPFSMDDVDPDTDVFRATVGETDSDDAQTTIVESPDNGSIWFVRVGFSGVTIGDDDFNDGSLYINQGGFNPEPSDSGLFAMRRITDDQTGGHTVETIVKGSEASEIEIGVYFPNAAFDLYGSIGVYGEAIRLRRGHDMAPKAFSPNQDVQTFDGTTDLTASFPAPNMITEGETSGSFYCEVQDTDDDAKDDAVQVTMSCPEYSDANNPTFAYEARRTGGSNDANQGWPTTYTELSGVGGTLPQSDNISGDVQTSPQTTEDLQPGGIGNGETTDYEIRGVIWEAGDRANTETYSEDSWSFTMVNASNIVM